MVRKLHGKKYQTGKMRGEEGGQNYLANWFNDHKNLLCMIARYKESTTKYPSQTITFILIILQINIFERFCPLPHFFLLINFLAWISVVLRFKTFFYSEFF